MSSPEDELLRVLDAHDALVAGLARGELSWEEFDRAYDSFYPRYPLDGHESDAEELLLFEKHEPRIALHRKVWDVFTRIKDDAFLAAYPAHDGGFIGIAEAIGRITVLANEHLAVR